MRRLKLKKINKNNTIVTKMIIVFFCILIISIILFNIYSKSNYQSILKLTNEKINSVLYNFFNDLITNDVINKESVNDILELTKNEKGEILTVNYDLEKTYKILTKVAKILQKGINDLENGQIDVIHYDKYLSTYKDNLILNVPLFIGSNNIFLNNIGPTIPVKVALNETLLTNVKTKITNYGFNNALLEIYITVEMNKLIITPIKMDNGKFNYDILIASLVVSGRVPEFYGDLYENESGFLDIPN